MEREENRTQNNATEIEEDDKYDAVENRCKYCDKLASSKSNLKTHQTKSKKCLNFRKSNFVKYNLKLNYILNYILTFLRESGQIDISSSSRSIT